MSPLPAAQINWNQAHAAGWVSAFIRLNKPNAMIIGMLAAKCSG